MRLDGREYDAGEVIDAHACAECDDGEARTPQRELRPGVPQGGEDEPDQEHHQPAQHVQLGVQIDDHVACLAAAVEQLVDGREGLYGPLQSPERERSAAGEHERSQHTVRAPHRADYHGQQQPEGREHRNARAHDQERMQRRSLLRLLRGQAAVDDEPTLVEPEVKRDRIEGERAAK